MANETLIAKLEQNLRQSRATRTRLAARLAELESEADIVRGELIEMDTLAGTDGSGHCAFAVKRDDWALDAGGHDLGG
jgi:hypothetical protein